MIEAVLGVLHRMVWADGDADPREIRVGVGVAQKMLGPLLTDAQIAATLGSAEPPQFDLEELPEEARFIVFRAAALVAKADEVIDPGEIALLEKLGRELGLNQTLIDDAVAGLHADVQARKDLDVLRTIASDLLGVSADAGPDEIRAQYRKQMITAVSESGDPALAAEQSEQIAWAYHTLLG